MQKLPLFSCILLRNEGNNRPGVALGAVGAPQDGDAAEGSEWWETVATHPTLTPSERVRGRGAVEDDVIAILTK